MFIRVSDRIQMCVLKNLNTKYYNAFSLLLAFLSKPIIGSPIEFQLSNSLCLIEFKGISDMPSEIYELFIEHLYGDIPDENQRRMMIEIDRKYWDNASIFIVFRKHLVIATAIFIQKNRDNLLPIEFSRIYTKNGTIGEKFDVYKDIGNRKVAEIYALKKYEAKFHKEAKVAIHMLFKAIWAKVIQTKTEFLYLTCRSDSINYRRLYSDKLMFKDLNYDAVYNNSSIKWRTMRMDCSLHEKKFANRNRASFFLQSFCRLGLKQCLYVKSNNILFQLLSYMRCYFSKLFYAESLRYELLRKIRKNRTIQEVLLLKKRCVKK